MAECAEYQPAEDDAHRGYHRDSFRFLPEIHIASFRWSNLEDVDTSHINFIAFNELIYFEKTGLNNVSGTGGHEVVVFLGLVKPVKAPMVGYPEAPAVNSDFRLLAMVNLLCLLQGKRSHFLVSLSE